jgi:hypothetical protein
VGTEKKKQLRHSYTLKDKFLALKALEDAEARFLECLGADQAYFTLPLVETVSENTGIPVRTLRSWIDKKESIKTLYLAHRRARKLKRFGSGRKPAFPKAEKIVAELVRDRRKSSKLVSKAFILKSLKTEAEKENPELYGRSKFSTEMVSGFMRRSRFSLRFPSCIRKDTLETSILICRAFHRELLQILSDSGETKYAKKPLDEAFGRFLLRYRFNGDEVPFRFGRVKSIVSLLGESSTQVTWPPGWEARMATLFLLMNALGCFAGKIVIIFQGSFTTASKKRLLELSDYAKKYPNVKVFFQKKAWMDGAVLTAITKEVFVPHVRELWAADGVDFSESLLQLDNGPGRTDPNFLKTLNIEGKAFLEKSPPNQTGFVQMIDDNCGRIFRDLACTVIEEEVVSMKEGELLALNSAKKREMMVRAVEKAYQTWMDPQNRYIGIGRRAALRTGLAMRIDDDCSRVCPVRFPEDYPSTIPESSGAPVQSYYKPVELSPAIIGDVIPSAPSTPFEPVPGIATPTQIVDEVGIFDGWSDEEERVFLEDEASASESSSDDETSARRRITRRRRWCLAGCDCERPLGTRKCMCERTGTAFCSSSCACDPAKCRSRRPESDEDD